ncbi:MAG: phage terminase large subunit [Proteobacteria bacterium]|nr:phage terminase large subunit [Pseudomonadota bacterium]
MINMHLEAESRQVLDALLRLDFASFLRKAMREVSPSDRLLWNWHLDAIVYELESVWGGATRLAINIPPRSLKSISVSVAFVAWCLGHDPSLKFICVSYNQALAEELARQCLRVMRSGWYQRVFPSTQLDRAKSSPGHFVTTKGGFRLATSVEGTLTGFGADFIIIDDPIKAEDAQSETARTRVNTWYDNTLVTRLNQKNTGRIVLVMHRLHIDDLTGHVLEKSEGWRHLCLPAIAQCDVEIATGDSTVYCLKAGEALHGARESIAALERIKADMGPHNFGAQYLQEPVAASGNLVRRDWFRAYDYEPVRQAGDQVVISWDTASKTAEMNSYSVATVWLMRTLAHGKQYYLLEVVRERLEYTDLRNRVLGLRAKWSPNYVLIEDKSSGQALLQELNREGFGAIAVTVEGEKTMRFIQQTPIISQGRVHLPRQASWLEDFIKELLQFPGGKHDDQVDSVSQFLKWAEGQARREFW